ncbi:MAG: efflux RND transporter periplasmic adaptor subunit [Bacillota bacterium]
MKKAGKWLIALFLALVILMAAFLIANHLGQTKTGTGFSLTPSEITGSIEAAETNVNVKVPGRIAAIEVEEGQAVTAGQIIAVMEAENIEAKSNQVKAVLDLAQSTYKRLQQLYQEGVLPQQKLDMARSDLRQAQAAYDEVRSYLNDSTVKAPIAGVVTSKSVEKGEIVSSGMPLVTITNLQDVWASVKVRESAINQFKVGQKVPVRVVGVPNKVYQGLVTYIAAKPSFATERAYQEKGEKDMVAFEVKLKLDNSGLLLRPGMTAVISLNH